MDRRQWSSRADPCAGRSRPRSRNGARREALGTRSREPLQGTAAVIVSPTRNHPARRAGARHPAARVCGMRAGDVHGTTGPDSRARRLSVRTASVQDYFKTNPGRKVGVCRFQPKAEMELRGVANSSPRQTHERRVLLIQITKLETNGASFDFCAALSRGGPQRPVTRYLGVFTAGSPGSPAGRPNGPKVSHRLELWVSRGAGCRVKSGSGPLERSLPKLLSIGVGPAGSVPTRCES